MTSRSQTSTNDQGLSTLLMFILLLSIFAPQKHQALFPFRGHRGSIHHGIHRLRAAGTVQQGQLLAPGCVQGAEGGGEEDSLAVQSKKNQTEPKRTIEHSTRAGGITDRLLQQPKLD